MGILADLDSVIDRQKPKAIYMGDGALHAFWAERARDSAEVPRIGARWNPTAYRGVPVIPTDWPFGWEIAEAA